MFQANGDTWKATVKHLKKDRSEALEELVLAIDPIDTAQLRGRIIYIDEVLTRFPRELTAPSITDDF